MKTGFQLSLRQQFGLELQNILDWWATQMLDRQRGGCYGRRDGYNRLFPQAPKGIIQHSRVLWTFSAAARFRPNPRDEEIAHKMYEYLMRHFRDEEEGGVYWMLDYQGNPVETRKQIYAQAFSIYALAEYYLLTQKEEALDFALGIFELIEKVSADPQQGGYLEAFNRQWKSVEDLRLSEKDANEAKSMNTHLHVMEAYTNLWRAAPDPAVNEALRKLIDCFRTRIITSTGQQILFFDMNWHPRSSIVSYGHDIECSWLIHESAMVLGDEALRQQVENLSLQMAEKCLLEGLDEEGGVLNERNGSQLDTDLHWWPQAEAVIGFWNAWELSEDKRYFDASRQSWQIIGRYFKDAEGGEWHWRLNADREVVRSENKAGPWKAPYHNGRMCLEMLRRLA